jgi:hypothetical protein
MTDLAGVVQAFIAAIKEHDVPAVCVPDGWRLRICRFAGACVNRADGHAPGLGRSSPVIPDYRISVEDTFVAGDRLAPPGTAQATLLSAEMLAESLGRCRRRGRQSCVAAEAGEWRVYADSKQTVWMVCGK